VDRYKQLLLKQRDIMIALTQRLNERDEQILALQDELDAYDKHQQDLEEKLDEKTAQLIHLQRVTIENTIASPVEERNKLSAALGDWGDKENGTRNGGNRIGMDIEKEAESEFGHDNDPGDVIYATSPKTTMVAPSLQSNPPTTPTPKENDEGKIDELTDALTNALLENTNTTKQLQDTQQAFHDAQNDNSRLQRDIDEAKVALIKLEQRQGEHRRAQEISFEKEKDVIVSTYEDKIRMLEIEVKNKVNDSHTNIDPEEILLLQQKNSTLKKERKAISTIMENKIKVLVNSVISASEEDEAAAMKKDLQALKRLVSASITALKNAENEG